MSVTEATMSETSDLSSVLARGGLVAWRRDASGRLTEFDGAGWALLAGWDAATRQDVDPIFSAIVEDDERRVRAAHVDGDPPGGEMEYRIIGPDGGVRWIRSVWSQTESGARCGIEQDVTELRRTRDDRRRTERLEMIARLSSGIAHDINNALTVILASADVVAGEDDIQYARDLAKDIREAALRAASLSRQVLMFSRTSGDDRRLVDVGDTARGMQRLLRKLVGDVAEVDVEAPTAFLVEADPSAVEQLVAGMVVAASGAGSEAHVTVQVEVEPDADGAASGARLMVRGATQWSETPVDIPAACKALGGLFHGVDASGTGTAWLPSARRRRQPPAPPASRPRLDKRILVVDDDPAVRMAIATCLRGTGAMIVHAGQPHEALALLRSGQVVDALVSDVMMPGMNGDELAARARELSPELPVLFMSGFSTQNPTVARLRRENERLLHKPFSADELRDHVASLLA